MRSPERRRSGPEVQNTKNVLSAKQQNLEKLESAQRAVVEKVRESAGSRGSVGPGAGGVRRDRVEEGLGGAPGEAVVGQAPRLAQVAVRVRGGTHAAVAMPAGCPERSSTVPSVTRRPTATASAPRGTRAATTCTQVSTSWRPWVRRSRDVRRIRHGEPERARRPGGRGARGRGLHLRRAPVVLLRSLDRARCTPATSSGTRATAATRRAARPTTTSSSNRIVPSTWPASYDGTR